MLYVLVSVRKVDSLVLYKLMYILSKFLKLPQHRSYSAKDDGSTKSQVSSEG